MKSYTRILFLFFILFFSFFNKIFAQLCQGSLGDPVVNITFGSGAGTGAPLPSTVTKYNFNYNACPADGDYTIANSSPDCFGNTWFALSEDHTPNDDNGYMMIINASFEPGDFYVQRVDGLCENTTYEFAAWILNILKSYACGSIINPNVTFNIETVSGSVLQSYQTGEILTSGSAQWKQYGSYFITPAGINSVIIRMTNNAPGGCGNDLVLDDITFRPCGPLVTVSISGFSKSVDVCTGDLSEFNLTSNISSGYDNPLYQWQVTTDSGKTWTDIPGAKNVTYLRQAVIAAGKYQYRLAIAQGNNITLPTCRIVSDVITVNVNPLPVADISANTGVCEGKSLMLSSKEGSSFSWRGPQNFTSDMQSPTISNVTFNNGGEYYVLVTSEKGCVNKDSTAVTVSISPKAYAGNDTVICEGTGLQLKGSGIYTVFYDWQPSVNLSDNRSPQPIASPFETTTYILTVTNGNCRNSDSVKINVIKKPKANAGADLIIIKGQTATLKGMADGDDVSYKWTPDFYLSNVNILSPSANPPYDTSYILNVQSNAGCGIATDTVLIKVYNDIYVPNAFTPNNDGKNDTWNIETLKAYPAAQVKVYNRYGELVYTNNGSNANWDGKYKGVLQNAGVYVYVIDLNNGKIIKGTVVLLL